MGKKLNTQKGFTLIELLVVIAIVVILSTLALTSYRTANVRARDARRSADMEQVRAALEMYRTDVGQYPNGGGCSTGAFNSMIQTLYSSIPQYYPVDELFGPKGDEDYIYCTPNALPVSSYTLSFTSEADGTVIQFFNP